MTRSHSSVATRSSEAGAIQGVRAYGFALIVVVVCTVLNWALSTWVDPTNLAMIYLLGQVLVSAHCERTASILCAIAGVLAFDFFFVPPVFSVRFGDTQYLITAVVLLTVGLVVSTLAARARAQMRAATGAAVAAEEERLRNSLLSSISHDLRTPLAVIAGSASNLRESSYRLSEAEREQLLAAIYEQSRAVSVAVSDVLEMTRLHAGPVKLDRQWYPLEELVGAALARCQGVTETHRIQTRLPLDLPMLHVDGVLVEKLLMNLIENAVKYTPAGTLITITAAHEGERIVLQVEDGGPGIPAGSETQLFEKFFRVRTEGSISGSGLGLSICRAIAQLHGGDIAAANVPAGGARFSVTFPFEPPPAMNP
jgi:K+-sensing histidine kinase KdpD